MFGTKRRRRHRAVAGGPPGSAVSAWAYDEANLPTYWNDELATTDALYKSSNCIRFDGTNDYIDLPTTTSLANTSSFCAWLRVHSFAAGNPIIGQELDHSASATVTFENSTTVRVRRQSTNHDYTVTAPSVDTWFHFAFTRSGGINKIWFDGVQQGAQLVFGTTMTCDRIGMHAFYSDYFDGDMCDVRWYNVALSQSDIEDIRDGAASQVAPVTWYPMAEGSGTKAYNVMANAKHGDLSGATRQSISDKFHYNIWKGFRVSGAVKIPALEDGSTAAEGSAITNPAVDGHNGAETLIDFQGSGPSSYAFGDTLPAGMGKTEASNQEHEFWRE